MDNNEINKNIDDKKPSEPQKQPDERGGILVQGLIKIYDPTTNEVFVNGRA